METPIETVIAWIVQAWEFAREQFSDVAIRDWLSAAAVAISLIALYYSSYGKRRYELEHRKYEEERNAKGLKGWISEAHLYVERSTWVAVEFTQLLVPFSFKTLTVPEKPELYLKTVICFINRDSAPVLLTGANYAVVQKEANVLSRDTDTMYLFGTEEYVNLVDERTRQPVSFDPWFPIKSGEKILLDFYVDLTALRFRKEGRPYIDAVKLWFGTDSGPYKIELRVPHNGGSGSVVRWHALDETTRGVLSSLCSRSRETQNDHHAASPAAVHDEASGEETLRQERKQV